ncbi:MAG TPA: hypothetical protein VMV00_02550 [Candidatus Baltobacteraceae bacterium]|nr:hypothetical protein [Candidatus Baltobacteraceae bacterium]
MIFLYYLNYAIFAAFLSLFILELGMAIHAVLGYGKSRERIRRYVMPLWGITGTFSVLYLVELVATYPNLVPAASPLYLAPVGAAALLVILRNLFLASSEVMGGHALEGRAFMIYSASTLAIAFLLSGILASTVSGIGVDVVTGSLNLPAMLFNGFSLSVFAAMALMGVFAAAVLIGDKRGRAVACLSAFLAPVVIVAALGFGISYGAHAVAANAYLVILYELLLAGLVPLYLAGMENARKLVLPIVFIGILVFAVLQNQMLFNGAASLGIFETNSAAALDLIIITVVCGALLIGALAYFVRLTFLKGATS